MEMWKMGCGTGGRPYLPENIFEEYRKAGFEYMEISLAHPEDRSDIEGEFAQYTSFDVNKIKQKAKENNVKIWSYHMPFGNEHFNPAWYDSEIRNLNIKRYEELIKQASELGAKVVVFHPSADNIPDEKREEAIKCCMDSFSKLVKTTNKCGVKLAVENLPRKCLCNKISEMLRILEADSDLRVCFDVNHLLIDSHKDFVNALGDKIVTLHLSDYDFVDEKHWIPGKGDIDWNELIQLLKGINYTGPYMNESRSRMECEVEERHTYKELHDASKEILVKYF